MRCTANEEIRHAYCGLKHTAVLSNEKMGPETAIYGKPRIRKSRVFYPAPLWMKDIHFLDGVDVLRQEVGHVEGQMGL
jgi:hypothetical protein